MPEVVSIHVSPATRMAMRSVPEAVLATGHGIAGDRYEDATHRHLTVQSLEELDEAADEFGAPIEPGATRRNVTISAGRLPRTPGTRLTVGGVALEVVRDAAPCRVMDLEIGDGARAALRRRAGVICRTIEGGTITVGDAVDLG